MVSCVGIGLENQHTADSKGENPDVKEKGKLNQTS